MMHYCTWRPPIVVECGSKKNDDAVTSTVRKMEERVSERVSESVGISEGV